MFKSQKLSKIDGSHHKLCTGKILQINMDNESSALKIKNCFKKFFAEFIFENQCPYKDEFCGIYFANMIPKQNFVESIFTNRRTVKNCNTA